MRNFSRFFASLALLALVAGPVWAAPLLTPAGPTIGSPADSSPGSPGWLELLPLAPIVFGITMRKEAGAIAAKFVSRAGAATKDYSDGVAAAGPEWEANTKAAEPSYEQGVQQAIADKRYSRGVSEAGATKYTANAMKLGTQRYQPGVANSQDAYQRGVAPYFDVIRNLVLPPKGPRRSPQNQVRANAVALALGNKKTGK